MKAISLWQPWASAISAGIKSNETRHWKLPVALIGQEVAIHAARKDTQAERTFWVNTVELTPYKTAGQKFTAIGIERYVDLPRGCILGIVRFTSCYLADQLDTRTIPDRAWGDFGPGRYVWAMDLVERFNTPVPFVGRQGFFDWERAAA